MSGNDRDDEESLRRGLDRLADRAPDPDLLVARWEGGRARSGGRTRTSYAKPVLAAAACAGILAAGIALVDRGDGSGSEEEQRAGAAVTTVPQAGTDGTPGSAGASARVGEQTREVGRGRAVVSVPRTWRSVQPGCDEPVGDGYFFTTGVVRACLPHRPDGVTTLQIDSLEATGPDPADPSASKRRGGRSYGVAHRDDEGVRTWVVVVPAEDARLTVAGPRDAADRIVASLRILPQRQTTVPQLTLGQDDGRPGYAAPPTLDEMRLRLSEAGLRMRTVARDGASGQDFARVRITPRPGTVTAVGSPVLLELLGRPGD